MSKRWTRFSRKLFLVVLLTFTAALLLAPMQIKAQQRASEGIDSVLIEKAEAGDAAAQFNLALQYEQGNGVSKDYTKALYWLHKAAEQGDARAQTLLGVHSQNGLGVPKNYTQAAEWYRKAANAGDSVGQSNLGVLYANGQGVTKDYSKALYWLRKAAEQGEDSAQFNLAKLYTNGDGVAKDNDYAAKLFREAAEQGYPAAQTMLGILYMTGNGVPKDDKQAALWLRKAADQGDADAQKLLNNYAQMQHDEEEAKHPRYIEVISLPFPRAYPIAQGAIVCPSDDAISVMVEQYQEHQADVLADRLTKGQSSLIHGRPTPEPDLKSYGCALIPTGTPMIVDTKNVVPVVKVKMKNGTSITGVTRSYMYATKQQMQEFESQRKQVNVNAPSVSNPKTQNVQAPIPLPGIAPASFMLDEAVSVEANVLEIETDNGQMNIDQRYYVKNVSSPPRTILGKNTFEFSLPDDAVLESASATEPAGSPMTIEPTMLSQLGHYAINTPIEPNQGTKDTVFDIRYHLPYNGSHSFTSSQLMMAQNMIMILPKQIIFKADVDAAYQSVPADPRVQTYVIKGAATGQTLGFTISGYGKMPNSNGPATIAATVNQTGTNPSMSTPDKDGVYSIGVDVSKPTVLSGVDPEFTDDARRAKFQGVVLVGLIVDAQGNPQNVHVIKGIGYGLDEKAVESVKQYKFRPAIKQSMGPVPVQLSIYVNFKTY